MPAKAKVAGMARSYSLFYAYSRFGNTESVLSMGITG